jgi:Antimicrobial peptide resistance and lipid A acylation protein PagP
MNARHDRWLHRIGAAAVAALVLAAGSASADELHLLINGKAFHIDPPAGRNYNEKNWGAGLQYDFVSPHAKWMPFLQASGFKDSFRHMSYYAGGGVLRHLVPDAGPGELRADVGVVAFVMTRKDYKNDKPFLGALPALSVGTDRVALNVTYIPKVEPKMVALWFVQLKLRIAQYK